MEDGMQNEVNLSSEVFSKAFLVAFAERTGPNDRPVHPANATVVVTLFANLEMKFGAVHSPCSSHLLCMAGSRAFHHTFSKLMDSDKDNDNTPRANSPAPSPPRSLGSSQGSESDGEHPRRLSTRIYGCCISAAEGGLPV